MKKFLFYPVLFLLLSSISYSQGVEKESELSVIVENAYKALDPTGLAVAVIKDGETSFFVNGKRNNETGMTVTKSSLFNIASCTKAFTATAISILVDEGKISWDDKVRDYIPEFQLKDPAISRKLNIADILSHRSGLSTFTGDLLWYHTNYTDDEVVKRMKYLPVEQDFREDFGYQNNMYMLAGEIIEVVTGKSWSEFLKERIFLPLNMENTLPSNDEIEEGMEIAYPHLEGNIVNLYDFNATKPAASVFSSVEDLSHWVKMLLNEGKYEEKEVISEKALRDCYTPHIPFRVSKNQEKQGIHFRSYGLGWSVYDFKGKKIIEHNGGMPGYISKITIVPEENLGFVVLNNGFEVFIHNALKDEILSLYLDGDKTKDHIKTYSDQKTEYLKRKKEQKNKRISNRIKGTKPQHPLETYAGTYEDKMYGKARIVFKDDNAVLTLLPAEKYFTSSMRHWHYNTYRVDFKDPFLPFGLVTFDYDSEGNVTGFKIDLPINDFHFNNLYFKKLATN